MEEYKTNIILDEVKLGNWPVGIWLIPKSNGELLKVEKTLDLPIVVIRKKLKAILSRKANSLKGKQLVLKGTINKEYNKAYFEVLSISLLESTELT